MTFSTPTEISVFSLYVEQVLGNIPISKMCHCLQLLKIYDSYAVQMEISLKQCSSILFVTDDDIEKF